MITLDEASALAKAHVDATAAEVKRELYVRRAPDLDRERGWAFSYNTTLWAETHLPSDGLVGNGPLFVDKSIGRVFQVPSGGFRVWIDEYNETGIPPTPKRLGWIGTSGT